MRQLLLYGCLILTCLRIHTSAVMPPTPPSPTVIYLNGTSSSGKSTLARALQEALAEPYLLIGIDQLIYMMPPHLNNWEGGPAPLGFSWQAATDAEGHPLQILHIGPYAAKMDSLLQALVLTMVRQGHNVIVDDVALGKEAIDQWRTTLQGQRVLWVGVKAPLAILEQREKARGDRRVGSARALFYKIHQDVTYDLECDTSAASLAQIVATIKQKVESASTNP